MTNQSGKVLTYIVAGLVVVIGATVLLFYTPESTTTKKGNDAQKQNNKENPKTNIPKIPDIIPENKDELQQQKDLISNGEIQKAITELSDLYFTKDTNSDLRDKIEEVMLAIAHTAICEDEQPDLFDTYTVQIGDSLIGIAKKISKQKKFSIEFGAIKRHG